MLNKLLTASTDYLARISVLMNCDKPVRPIKDIRCVFYHGIGNKSSESMRYLNDEIPKEIFEAHIDYLRDNYVLISLTEAVNLIMEDRFPYNKPVCTISFDDGLQSVYSQAYPILKEKQISFDVFLNTSVRDNDQLLWLHALNYLLSSFGARSVAESMNILIDPDLPEVPQKPEEIERWSRDNFDYFKKKKIIKRLFEHYGLNMKDVAKSQDLYLTPHQIEEMSHNGVDFYSHTHSHFPLDSFPDDKVIEKEIDVARDLIEKQGKSIKFISFPFGMKSDYGERAAKYALSAGHRFIVEVGDGLNSPDRIKERNFISRVGLGNISAEPSRIYAATEIRPVIKSKVRSLLNK